MLKSYLLVGLGGMVGSVLRFAFGSLYLHHYPGLKFPWATFLINLSGCFLIGLVAALTETSFHYNSGIRLLVISGFLGGFTTFSAFGLETLHLYKEGLTLLALLYAGGSVMLGCMMVWLAYDALL